MALPWARSFCPFRAYCLSIASATSLQPGALTYDVWKYAEWNYSFKKEFDAPFPGHQTLYIFESTIVYFTATLMALSPNFAMTMVSDTAQDAVPSTAEEEPISLPSAA